MRFQTAEGETGTTRINGNPFYRYDQGQELTLLYLPSDPRQITLPELVWWGVTLLFIVIAVFIVLPLWVSMRKLRASRTTPAEAG